MIRKLFHGLNKYFPIINSNIRQTKIVSIRMDMEDTFRVYVSHDKEEEQMKISFEYSVPHRSCREFNFMRSKNEKLETGIVRIKAKIEAALLMKTQKKGKKVKVDSGNPDSEHPQLEISLLNPNGEEYEGNTSNIEAWSNNSTLKINNTIYKIIENGPSVSSISLPRNIMAGYPVYPRLCLEFATRENCQFVWYRSLTKQDEKVIPKNRNALWQKLASCFFYMTTIDDVGHKLKIECVPVNNTAFGKKMEAISSSVVSPGPGKCPFEKRHQYTQITTSIGETRFVSYNILADLYADSDTARNFLFPYCPSEYLDYEYRKQLYLKEILGYNTDILCLQEVDRKVFNYDLMPMLSDSGLSGIYNEKGGQVAEGLACFYRSSKFVVVHSEAIILSELVKSEPIFEEVWLKMQANEKLSERILNRTTALQVVLLECIDIPKKRILLGNTHLYFHPESDNIRLLQATLCITYLENMYKKFQEDSSYTTALVLSGDFNSCPEFGVYQLMTQGSIPNTCEDFKSNPEETIDGFPIKHSFNLCSACGTPAYTNFTQGFQGCLDYIFYDATSLSVKDVVPFPVHKDVTEHVALPSKVFPSDHLALICTLKWK